MTVICGFDTEWGYERLHNLANGRLHGDMSTMRPVCACLSFEDGREVRLSDNYDQLQDFFSDPAYTFVVHGAHAEYGFCRQVGIRFPANFRDTLMMGLLMLHASEFHLPGGAYRNVALTELMSRYHIPFLSAGDKDAIRDSILRLNHLAEFSMQRVLSYCAEDAKAIVLLYPQLRADMIRLAGPNAERNLIELYQPYALLMAEASRKGLRFDGQAWDRLQNVAPCFRARLQDVLRQYGYEHDGVGIGAVALALG